MLVAQIHRPKQVIITVNPSPATPTITAAGPVTICQGSSVTLTSSATTGNTWSTGATTQAITVSTAGSYTVTAALGSCTKTSAAKVVTVNPLPTAPTISASGSTTICSGGSVTLTSSSTTGNTWSTGATTQSITVSAAGTYSVTYNNGTCTATSTPTTVTVVSTPVVPTITAAGATTFCQGGSVVLTSSATSGNTWSTGATTQSITVTSAGNYTVTSGNVGCSATSIGTTVIVNPNPTAPTIAANGPTTFCQGGNVVLTSSATSGNTWSTGATSQVITVTTAGVYSVTVSNGTCSTTSTSNTVVVNPLPNVTLSPLSMMCVNWAPAGLTGGLPAGGTYTGTGVTSNTFNPATAGIGTHPITYSYTNSNSCSNTATANLLVDACAGLDEINSLPFEIYPNPSTGMIQLQSNGHVINTINVYDETGRLVKIIQPKNNSKVETLSLKDLSNGIYTLIVNSNEFQKAMKITLME